MKKKYVVAVSDMVQVPVEGKIVDENGITKPFKFTLTCKRVSASQFKEKLDADDFRAQDVMAEVTTGWSGQRLVMEEDGVTPAEFCPDALEALLDISGMAMKCFQALGKASGAQAKN
jgi:hypothetical protein